MLSIISYFACLLTDTSLKQVLVFSLDTMFIEFVCARTGRTLVSSNNSSICSILSSNYGRHS